MALFEHPNGMRQEIAHDGGFVWVHPRAKKSDFGWSPKKKGMFSAKAKRVGTLADAINKHCADEIMKMDHTKVILSPVADCDCDEDAAYQRGFRDAIAKCWVPGATIETTYRVQQEARRLGL